MTDARLNKILGAPVSGWVHPPRPEGGRLEGRFAVLEPLSAAAHATDLFSCFSGHDDVWDYMPYGPFATEDQYMAWVHAVTAAADPLFYAIRNLETGRWEGVASYLRIKPDSGSIEVGHINFSPALQRTPAATEAMYLMMKWVFDAGYRRYEWKCNARNIASRRAAQRLGFSYEGIFRQAAVIKGYNRDTAWFAMIDSEWPQISAAFEKWFAPQNFAGNIQKLSLSELTCTIRYADDPVL